jgi:hypothetical protein
MSDKDYERKEKTADAEWEFVQGIYVYKVLSGNYQNVEFALAAMEDGEIVQTPFAEYRLRQEKEGEQ